MPTNTTYFSDSSHKHTAADFVDGAVMGYGRAIDRPPAGFAQRLYFASDTQVLYRDNGASWENVSSGASFQSPDRFVVNADNGNDTAAVANSQSRAFATVQAALNAAASSPGSQVIVLPGTYAERITLKDDVDLVAAENDVVTLEVNSAAAGDMISNGGIAGMSARMLGKWRVRRLGAAASGNNTLVSVSGLDADIFIEFCEMYNGASTTNETECFKTAEGAKLRMKQVAPGLCQSLSYDLFVDYGSASAATRSYFELDAWDLMQAGQSIVELTGSYVSSDVRLRGRRARSGATEALMNIVLLDPTSDPNVLMEFAEYMYAPASGVINAPNESGLFEIRTPLMYSLADKPIVAGVETLIVRDADIVAAGSNITAVENIGGLLRFHNCRFFPTGTGKPIDTGTVECYNSYTKIANSGPTIVGTLTTATGMAVPVSPVA